MRSLNNFNIFYINQKNIIDNQNMRSLNYLNVFHLIQLAPNLTDLIKAYFLEKIGI